MRLENQALGMQESLQEELVVMYKRLVIASVIYLGVCVCVCFSDSFNFELQLHIPAFD